MLKRHCVLRLRSFGSTNKPRRRAVDSLHRGCLDALPCLVPLFTSIDMVFCLAAILRFSSRSLVHKLQLCTAFERIWMWILVSWVRMLLVNSEVHKFTLSISQISISMIFIFGIDEFYIIVLWAEVVSKCDSTGCYQQFLVCGCKSWTLCVAVYTVVEQVYWVQGHRVCVRVW